MQVNSISCLSDQEKEGNIHVKDKIERQKSKKKKRLGFRRNKEDKIQSQKENIKREGCCSLLEQMFSLLFSLSLSLSLSLLYSLDHESLARERDWKK